VVTVVIPTLAADAVLGECLRSLEAQTFRDFEVIVVDNSGQGLARGTAGEFSCKILENRRNAGFGAAVNQGFEASRARFVATLNDDAVAHPGWLGALVRAIETQPEAGMCASQVRLEGENLLDSAGMLISADGSSKQRGHRQPPETFPTQQEVLLPSASAALYRRSMLEEIGGFDGSFFLYSEDTDLGLRARWAGWKCIYVPGAVVTHRYSHTAGRASPLKAYLVERNRLFVIVKNFPAPALAKAPLAALARYAWHAASLVGGRGAAAQFRREGGSGWKLVFYVLRSHLALAAHGRRLWKQRREIRRRAKIRPAEFQRLLERHAISPREVAAL
jgi:GT2 family glycosyltransferase